MSYKLIKTEHSARRGEFTTVHGTVQTPAFMNVATTAAIKAVCPQKTLKISDVRLCFATHIIFISDLPTKLFTIWVVCISLQTGKDQFLLTVADFRYFLLQNSEKLKKKAFIFHPILMDVKFLWALKKVCRFSQI